MSGQFLVTNAHSHFFAIVRPDGRSNADLDTGTRCENTPMQTFFLVLNVLVQNSYCCGTASLHVFFLGQFFS